MNTTTFKAKINISEHHHVFKCFTPTIRVRIPLSIQFENDQKRYLMLVSGLTLRSVWPDISKAWQKSSHISFYLKITQKVIKYLGYFCKRNCHQHLSKSLNLVTLIKNRNLNLTYLCNHKEMCCWKYLF